MKVSPAMNIIQVFRGNEAGRGDSKPPELAVLRRFTMLADANAFSRFGRTVAWLRKFCVGLAQWLKGGSMHCINSYLTAPG